ncbi:MAG: leucine-rich repeat domain-containing protein [Bacteroidales bacterium]|nr:leucine-rich repeat domain-containing protein [Candidatus Egerieousia equi]
MLQVVLRRRTNAVKSGGVPSNQIWYDAPSKVTLYSETDVISHTFRNGRGIITFNNDITEVKDWLRETQITNVYLPKGITKIGNNAFFECFKLALTSLPSGVTYIGDHSFTDCEKLALTSLPSGVTYIGSAAFFRCVGINGLTIPIETPPTLKAYTVVFDGTYFAIFVPAKSVNTYKNATGWKEYPSRIWPIPK